MPEKLLSNHNFTGLNKGQIKEFSDYLTLLKEGFLFNLNFEKIEFENKTPEKIINILYNKLGLQKDLSGVHSKLKETIYYIFKKVVNYDYKNKNKPFEEVMKEVLQISFDELEINQNIDNRLIKLFITLYNKSNFLTRLDLMSVKGIKNNELKEIIYNELQINPGIDDKAEQKAVKKINTLFKEAINVMGNNFKLKIPKNYKDIEWYSLDDFINYAFSTSETKKTGYKTLIDCAIIKTMSVCNAIIDNPLLFDLNQKLEKIIKKIKKVPGFHIINEKDGEIEFSYNNPLGGENSYTRGKVTYRTKDDIKILLKLIYNRKYSKLDFFKDLLGFRVEIEKPEDAENGILLFKNLFESDTKLKNKGLLNNDFLEECKILHGINVSKDKKSGTSETFVNAALIGTFIREKGDKSTIPPGEIQFVYTGNKNESGYNKHEIYDTKKYISAISRLFGYITLDQIKTIIHHFALKSGLPESGILHHLTTPQKGKKSFLMRTRFSTCSSCNYYLSRDIYDEKLQELYKDITTNYIDINKDDYDEIYNRYIKIKI
ncbi:hypothetical protein EOM39_01455 [Candidatus Gracilibacteria bacterium]|nr:hypothetical protein [Candidatus Gracilibacteria bacterium]